MSAVVNQADRERAAAHWIAAHPEDASAAEIAGFILSGKYDSWTSPQAFAAHRIAAQADLLEALLTNRDYIADAANGALTYEGSGDGFKAMAKEDLARIDAAIAKATNSPAVAPQAHTGSGTVRASDTGAVSRPHTEQSQ